MAWDDTHTTASDPSNPDADESLTADEWNEHVRAQKDARLAEWTVYESGGTWYAEGPQGSTETSGTDPATVLQHASDNASLLVNLRSGVPDTNDISSTVTIPSGVSFLGPGLRGTATVYGSADPVFKMEGGGYFADIWLRKDVSSAMGSGDGIVLEGMGRGSEARNINVTRTNGNGIVMNGCQQMTVFGLYFASCGDPGSDTGELRLDNHPDDGLETNAINLYAIHSHGDANPQGSLIQMRASNHTDNDHPRNIRLNGINLENGPSGEIPIVEVAGRNNHFENIRMQGIDDSSTAFQLQAPRARDMSFANMMVIGGTGAPLHGISNAEATTASGQGGVDWAPMLTGQNLIDVDGSAINLASYNQTNTPAFLRGIYNPGNIASSNLITVSASQDASPEVILADIRGGGTEISVQGARLGVSNVHDVTWASHISDFGPRLLADDGSFSPAQFTASTSGGSGLAVASFSGDFELKNGSVTAFCDRGGGVIVQGSSLDDTSGNGDLDTARAHVVNVSDGTDAADGVTVNFAVHPRAP